MLPWTQVRNVPLEATPEEVQAAFEAAGVTVHSVVYDVPERGRNVALLRLPPPALPWTLSKQQLMAPNELDVALQACLLS